MEFAEEAPQVAQGVKHAGLDGPYGNAEQVANLDITELLNDPHFENIALALGQAGERLVDAFGFVGIGESLKRLAGVVDRFDQSRTVLVVGTRHRDRTRPCRPLAAIVDPRIAPNLKDIGGKVAVGRVAIEVFDKFHEDLLSQIFRLIGIGPAPLKEAFQGPEPLRHKGFKGLWVALLKGLQGVGEGVPGQGWCQFNARWPGGFNFWKRF